MIPHPEHHGQRRAALRGAVVALALGGLAITGVALTSGGSGGDADAAAGVADATGSSSPIATPDPATAATSLPATTPPAAATTDAAAAATTDAAAVTTLDTTPAAPTTAPGSPAAPTSVATAGPVTSAVAEGVPAVDAAAYAVLDTSTGTWLATSAADEARPVASTIKLLTSYVVMQAGEPDRVVTVPDLELDPEESAIGLYPGEQLSRAVLLRAMMIVSANDAARALAVDVGGSQEGFVTMMNAAATSLGLAGTVAVNPIGLDAEGAHSTARDLATLASLLMQDPTFRETVARTSASLHGQTFPATNDEFLTSYPGADGVKTGHTTQAGWCLVASATRDGRRIVAVVLGSSSDAGRVAAASALLDWAYAQA